MYQCFGYATGATVGIVFSTMVVIMTAGIIGLIFCSVYMLMMKDQDDETNEKGR